MSKNLLPGARSRKGVPPKLETVQSVNTEKLQPGAMKQVNMQIEKSKKIEMMTYAQEHDASLTEIVIKAFDFYKAAHP